MTMTNANAGEETTLTIDKLMQAIETIERLPKFVFASYSMLPQPDFLKFEDGNTTYTLGHPNAWARFKTQIPRTQAPHRYGAGYEIPIVDFDAEANENERRRVMLLMCEKMLAHQQAASPPTRKPLGGCIDLSGIA